MAEYRRDLMRAANRLHDHLRTQVRKIDFSFDLDHMLRAIENLQAQVQAAQRSYSLGWLGAGKYFLYQLCATRRRVRALILSMPEVQQPEPVLTVGEVYRELIQTAEEFDGIVYDHDNDRLVVHLGPIKLEGVYLGPFDLALSLNGSRPQVTAIALDPHPASGRPDVTHPHVSDEVVCLGEGRTAVEQALRTGRFCDALMLVRSVLTNYNSDSPHVKLKDWDGDSEDSECSQCGGDASDNYSCSWCDAVICGDCAFTCQACEEFLCLGCVTPCPDCGLVVCPNCKGQCSECGEQFCVGCLNDDGLCSECQEAAEQEKADETREDVEQSTPEIA